MKKITSKQMFAISMGNFGHGILTGIVMSHLIYFYQPTAESGLPVLIPTNLIFGFISILGLIKAFGHIFDAITDPIVASISDRSTNPLGRRIPIMKKTAIPFAILSALVFFSPINDSSYINGIFLAVILYSYYLIFTMYIVPYNALLPELVQEGKQRLTLYTMTSLTFILGTGAAYLVPSVVAVFKSMGLIPVTAWRITFVILCVIACITLLIPTWTIKEKEYVTSVPSHINTKESIKKTFQYRDFRIFVASDLVYYIALAFFQGALGYYVVVLLGLEEWMMTVAFIITMTISVIFYIPVNIWARRFGKKKTLLAGFALFIIGYIIVCLFQKDSSIPVIAQASSAFLPVAIALAIFGIIPNTIVADLAEYDTALTNDKREGMFFAARSLVFKIGQSIAFLIIPAVASIGKSVGSEVGALGVRLTAIIATVFCTIGFIVFFFYDEKKVLSVHKKEDE